MSNAHVLTLQLVAAASTAVAASQTPGSAGALTINGTLASGGVATFDVARRVAIASAGNDSNHTFTITGTGRNGNVQSEVLTGPNVTPVNSVRDYLTVTSVVISAAATGAITVGTSAVASSEWIVNDYYVSSWSLAGGISGPAGTTYSLEVTYDDPNAALNSGLTGMMQFSEIPGSINPPHAFSFQTIIGASGDNQYSLANQPVAAHRLTILSGTGLVTLWSIQSGIIS